MKKVFILDTSVFLHDPEALVSFQEHTILLYAGVVRELDRFKSENDARGYAARTVFRALDYLSQKGDLSNGMPLSLLLENTPIAKDLGMDKTKVYGSLRFVGDVPNALHLDSTVDHSLINITYVQKEEGHIAVLVSKDISLRVQARIPPASVTAEDYETDKKQVHLSDVFSPVREYTVNPSLIDAAYHHTPIPDEQIPTGLYENEYFILRHGSQSVIARYTSKEGISPIATYPKGVQRIKARNKEQKIFLDALMRPEIQLVFGIGQAGTGKTLLALAASLEQTLERDSQRYEELHCVRAPIPLGKDIGYLPGGLDEKMRPWLGAMNDALTVIYKDEEIIGKTKFLQEKGILHFEPPLHFRGRSIPKTIFVVDEAQNLSPHEVKTIITRAGTDSKIILLGDPHQIDNYRLDSKSNGLTVAATKLRGESLCAIVSLNETERSPLAELAARKL